MHRKRIVLYHHYDAACTVDEHVLYTLAKLKEEGLSIIFVSGTQLENTEGLSLLAEEIRQDGDGVTDWEGWRAIILSKKPDFFSEYDEIILMNDSCYGPVLPLAGVFHQMDSIECDFYGITGSMGSHHSPDYVHAYFMVIRKTVFSAPVFRDFFRKFPTSGKKRKTNCEIEFSQNLYKNGFKSALYCNYDQELSVPTLDLRHDFVVNAVPLLLRKYGCPFIKCNAFANGVPAISNHFNKASHIFKALKEVNSPYPPNLISDHIRRTRPASWQKNLPDTLHVLPAKQDTPVPAISAKIAVFAHIFYEENINLLERLKNIPAEFDLYVSTCSHEVERQISGYIAKADMAVGALKIETIENRGRDLLAWLSCFRDVQSEYDFALKIKDKKSPNHSSEVTWQWKGLLGRCLLDSRVYVRQLLDIFIKNPKVGLIFPFYPPVLLFLNPNLGGDRNNLILLDTILKRCGVRQIPETFVPVFPVGNEFWYRPKALEPLFNSQIGLTDFPMEPLKPDGTILHALERSYVYIAQANGYEFREVAPLEELREAFQLYEDYMLRRNGFQSSHFVQVYPQDLPPFRHQLFSLLATKSSGLARILYPFARAAYHGYKKLRGSVIKRGVS